MDLFCTCHHEGKQTVLHQNTCKIKALRAWCCKFSNLRNLLVTARKIFKSNEWDIYVFYVVEQNMKISQACDNHRFVFPFI